MLKTNDLTIRNCALKSDALAKNVKYCAITPRNYENAAAKFPVLYLLHGLFGRFDNWLTNTRLVEYASDFPGVIVCADGGDNWYSDAPHLKNHRYESHFFDELFPAVERKFNVGQTKNSRAIAGLSMGGYGAFKFAFRQPEMFCFAASMSGAFHAAEISDDAESEIWREIFPSADNVFSDENVRAANDLFRIVEDFPSENTSELPYFYFDCGRQDSFLTVNKNLSELFQRREIAHEFRVFSGRHDWNYWNTRLADILRTTAKKFANLSPPTK